MDFVPILRDIFVLVVHILTDNCLKNSQRAMQYFALLEEYNGKTKDNLGGHHPEWHIADSREKRMEETRIR